MPSPSRLHYAWIVLAMGMLSVFGSLGLARFGYSIILPSMQDGLDLNNTHAGALATANLIGYLALSVLGGALASRFGPRAVIAGGLAVNALAMLFTGFAHNFGDAMIWRTFTGIGSGAANVPVMGLMAAWFALRRRGLATGIAVAGSSVALITLGVAVPRALAAYGADGWRVCWIGCGALGVLLAIMALVLLRNRPRDLGLQPLGADLSVPPAAAPTAPPNWAAVYKSGPIWHLGTVYVAFGFSYMIYMTFFVKALIAEGKYDAASAGNLFMTMGWFSLVCGLIWGTVSDRIGRKGAMIIVYLIQTVSFALFALVPTPLGFTISAILFGLTAWSIPAIVAAACGDMLGPRLSPAGVGFVTLFLGIGQALGPMIAGAMADRTGSFLPAVLLASGVALLGALAAAFLKPVIVCADEDLVM